MLRLLCSALQCGAVLYSQFSGRARRMERAAHVDLVFGSLTVTALSFARQAAAMACFHRYPKNVMDVKMVRKMIPALLSLVTISVSAATFPTMQSGRYHDFCDGEWTKKGVVDQEMSKFCQSRQEEGYDEAQEIIKKFESESWIQAVIDHAVKNWTKKACARTRWWHSP